MSKAFQRPNCVRMVKAVLFSVLGLLWQARQVVACDCYPSQEYCDVTNSTDLLVSGTILNRTVEEGDPVFIGDEMYIYNINAARFYKIPPNTTFAQALEFESFVESSLCGLYLEVGVEYLVGMYLRTDGGLYVTNCGPTREFASLTNEQLEVLQNGGNCVDPCDDVVCGPYKECVLAVDGNTWCEDFEVHHDDSSSP